MTKELLNIELSDDTNSAVTLSSLTKDCLNFLRTESGGTDGYLYFNGKKYMTMSNVKPHLLKRDGASALTQSQISQVYENIGWLDETVTVTITADQGQTLLIGNAKVVATYDGTTVQYTWNGTPLVITIPLYLDYTLSFTDVTDFETPVSISNHSDRGGVRAYTVQYTFTGTTIEYLDLSRYDINGNLLQHGSETANCYIIHNTGYYSIPLVYGNAITDSEVNISSYMNVGIQGSHDLLNCNDEKISSPYIEEDIGEEIIHYEMLWCDNEDFVIEFDGFTDTAVTVVKHLKLNITSIPTDENANMLIAVKNEKGDIAWSWHLWFVNGEIITKEYLDSTGEYHYEAFPYNLGWVADEISGGYSGEGLTYQWGRKDPMPLTVVDDEHYSIETTASSLGTAIKHPNTFYMADDDNYWWEESGKTTSFINFWDNDENLTMGTIVDKEVVKTIYDPCPAQFSVPTKAATVTMSTSTIDPSFGWQRGVKWNDIIYHASGYRIDDDGHLVFQYDVGMYTSTTLEDSAHALTLVLQENNIEPLIGLSLSHGMSVRPYKMGILKG